MAMVCAVGGNCRQNRHSMFTVTDWWLDGRYKSGVISGT